MSARFPALSIKTESLDQNDESPIRVGETYSIKDEPLDEEEAVDPLDEDDNYIPDIDVSQFLQQNIVTVTHQDSEFDKRIFPQKSKKSHGLQSEHAVGTKESKFINQIRNIGIQVRKDGILDPRKHRAYHVTPKSSQTAKRARKVELERERRAELTQLYDRLQYWTEADDAELSKGAAPWRPRPDRQVVSYNERMNDAIRCIEGLENSLEEKEKIYSLLLSKNIQLRQKLGSLKGAEIMSTKDHLLYRCDQCPAVQTNFKTAFSHESVAHGQSEGVGLLSPSSTGRGGRTDGKRRKSVPERRKSVPELPVRTEEFRCRQCLTTAQDKTLLHLHSLLHKELIYFQCPWPRCELVFGVPSKLKTHHFLSHDMVLAAEEKCTIDINARVLLTSNLIRMLGRKEFKEHTLALVDNFLEASLDASLIFEELKMDNEVEEMSEEKLLNALGMELDPAQPVSDEFDKKCKKDNNPQVRSDHSDKNCDDMDESLEAALEDELEDEFERDFLSHGDDPLGLVSDSDLTEPAARKIKLLRRESRKVFSKV